MNERTPMFRVVLWVLVYVAVGVFIVGSVVVTISTYTTAAAIRNTQKDNTSTLNYAKSSLALLKDCTEHSGDCYKKGQKNQVDILGQVLIQQVATVACADAAGTQDPVEIKACVERTIAQLQ